MATALKRSVKKSINHALSFICRHKTTRHNQDIRIVVRTCEASDFFHPAVSGTHALVLIERHTDTVARSTNCNAWIHFTRIDRIT